MNQRITLFVLALLMLSTVSFAQTTLWNHLPKGKERVLALLNKQSPQKLQTPSFRSAGTKQGLDSLIGDFWDFDLGMWVPEFKEHHIYNADGLEEMNKEFSWDEDLGDWANDFMEEYTYDANGNLVKSVGSYWEGQWMPLDSTVLAYDADGNLVELQDFYWSMFTSSWEPSGFETYSYNPDGTLNMVESAYWTGSAWIDNAQEIYTYDASGNLTEVNGLYWDGINWVPDSKVVHTYDTDGRLVELLYQYWDDALMQWANDTKDEYTYDAFDNVPVSVSSYWDDVNMVWVPDSKLESVHDNDYALSDLLVPLVYQDDLLYLFSHKLDEVTVSEWDGVWIPLLKVDFYYSEYVFTGTSEPEAEELGAFPNPASDHISLQLPDDFAEGIFRVFDAQGRQVLVQDLQGSGEISVAGLRSGLYFYTLGGDERKMCGKFVKE